MPRGDELAKLSNVDRAIVAAMDAEMGSAEQATLFAIAVGLCPRDDPRYDALCHLAAESVGFVSANKTECKE